MKPTNKNPNEFERLNAMRKFDQNLTLEGSCVTQNLVSVANKLIKNSSPKELITAVSESPARVIDLIKKVNRSLENKEESKIDLNVSIIRDPRMVFQLSTLLDHFEFYEGDLSHSFRQVYNRAGEIIQQDLFYLAEEYEKINYNIFETDDELPF